MQILVDAALGGYALTFHLDDGTTNTYPETVDNLLEAMGCANILADEVEKETGIKPEARVTAEAIRANKHRDIAAYRAWNHPQFWERMG